MPYISGDGRVVEKKPWGIGTIYDFFSGIFFAVAMFFNTLFHPADTKYGSGYTRNYRPGSGPPRPPQKRLGGLNLKPSMNVPGSCSSCRGG